ncbi:MAG: class I SAM-dependent methyltransferase [Zoogloea oleivorans]|jgi:ubiquinone/menaquinone biosynthesis C-methylase UbiE|uniref:class I SAM-dependent methyltransferase n=1 Tax=Zoogloea oleivorans TaxID=1552750 RepID=UPI002A35F101|nr:class I SAM-dependent methyltransferase [Zoogloea oleivorans]MDY0036608.1 class I SAM-dependent methyltransferase [Zoogloea oleivorans]
MNEQERKQHIKATFDAVAARYDCDALRFFEHAAALLPEVFDFEGGESVLDVAAGTGIPALAMAPHLPRGTVTAVDLSEGMLAQAAAKCHASGLGNVVFQQMDMTAMAFQDAAFDAANCSFGVFFVEEMAGTLRHIAAKVRPGGKVVTTHFRAGSFGPLAELFLRRVDAYGLPAPPPGWLRVASEEQNIELFEAAGLAQPQVASHDVGYLLDDAAHWWEVIWNAGFCGLIAPLDENRLARFRQEHLAEVSELMTADGLPLDIGVLITKGVKPRQLENG